MSRPAREIESKVRAKRLATGQPVRVETRTLGTPLTYVLGTANVSRSGLLLHIGNNRRVPYRVNTLLELTVDSERQVFEQPVSCLGKIVRIAPDQARRPQFGVQIIQLEGPDLASWENGMAALESGSAVFLPVAG